MRQTLVGLALTLSLAACSQSTPPGVPLPATSTKSGTTLTKQDVVTVTTTDVVTNGKVTKTPGQLGKLIVYLLVNDNKVDSVSGCNTRSNNKATVTVISKDSRIPSPDPVQIADCGEGNALCTGHLQVEAVLNGKFLNV